MGTEGRAINSAFGVVVLLWRLRSGISAYADPCRINVSSPSRPAGKGFPGAENTVNKDTKGQKSETSL